MDFTELDKDGLVRMSVATLANLFASAGDAELAEKLEIRLDATTAVLAAVLVERILAATEDVRTRDVTARNVQERLEQSGSRVAIRGPVVCVEPPPIEDAGPGCCVG
jgi:hypothetical protein